ncbi:hypothetical protein DFH28DRAFT_1103647 [Melampsora americana]|nr:hypothetical protein DFH28DRAFT_1103647 [Melampsora americana]
MGILIIPYGIAIPNTSNGPPNETPVSGNNDSHRSTTETLEHSPDELQGEKDEKVSAKISAETWSTSSTPLNSLTLLKRSENDSSSQVLADLRKSKDTDQPSLTEKSLSATSAHLNSSFFIDEDPFINSSTISIPSNSITFTQTHDYTNESIKILGCIILSFMIFFIIGLIPIMKKKKSKKGK